VISIQDCWLDAVQAHSRDTPTFSVPDPPDGPKEVVVPLRFV
jgi:hypothetical protein